jgi:hypothetical protein
VTLFRRLGRAANALLRGFGYQVIASAAKPASRGGSPAPLPSGAEDYLRPDHPRLTELERAYAALDPRVTTPLLWKRHHVSRYDLRYFRGDNAYVWQVRDGASELNYALTAYYVKNIDALGLLDCLQEDELFGVHAFTVDGRKVSRDLLDSIVEINFLERHLALSSRPGLSVLDIGAGYGRLAHRMVSAFPGIGAYFCADAVAVSTFLCDYYLRFRGVADRAHAIPLDRLDAALAGRRIDLAINIRSFSECTPGAIEWWLELLGRHDVKHLLVVPNQVDHGGEKLLTNAGADMLPLIERRFRLSVRSPKYVDPALQRHGIQPTWHYLFEAKKP